MAEDNSFKIAADAAVNQFNTEILPKMSAEERKGVEKIQAWWKAHYMKAGHRNLARGLLYDIKP